MTISKRVRNELSLATSPVHVAPSTHPVAWSARIETMEEPLLTTSEQNKGKAWTAEEHTRFLEALELFPTGPWKAIATYIRTTTARQAMTHAQKCRQKMQRRQRGLRTPSRARAKNTPPASDCTATSESPRSSDAIGATDARANSTPATTMMTPIAPQCQSHTHNDWLGYIDDGAVMEMIANIEPIPITAHVWSAASQPELTLSESDFDDLSDASVMLAIAQDW